MQRKNYPADFKAKVSLEAIREQRTMAELSGAFAVHGTMISRWKRHVLKIFPLCFQRRTREKIIILKS